MTDTISATVKGWRLILLSDPDDGGAERWVIADGSWDGPNEPKPLRAWPAAIDAWEVEKQKAQGYTVWCLDHESPKHWSKAEAVFRSGLAKDDPDYHRLRYSGRSEQTVHMRNGRDPRSLFGRDLKHMAPDTEEVAEAIERARDAHRVAVEAGRRYREAVAAIPRLTEEQWKKLPQKKGLD